MKKLCGMLMVLAMGGAMTPVWARGGCRVAQPGASRVVYVPVQQIVYVSPYHRLVCEPAPVCNPQRVAPRGIVYAPRVMAQPGYWVQRDLGCGRTQRAWHSSQRVVVSHPGSSFIRARW